MTFDEIVTAVKQQGGFDVSDAVVGQWVNEVYRRAIVESGWMTAQKAIGSTIAGTSTYALDEWTADVVAIYLEDEEGPAHYGRVGANDLWDLKSGRRGLSGAGGVFGPAYDDQGNHLIELYPAPVVTGVDIVGLVVIIPATMTGSLTPVVPIDMHGDLLDGAIALGLLRIDERPDSAALFDQRFREMVSKLRRRKNSRVGSQPARIQVQGYDW